jgi:hydroxymethylpyrimidine pyrophosphatase-like HAD family hydrolase
LNSRHKISFYGVDLDEGFLGGLGLKLAEAGYATNLVYSSNRDLDVLPLGVDKGAAAAFLAMRWSIAHSRVVVVGDSGNDKSMFAHGFRGITVRNAHPELRSIIGREVYHATVPFAAGVLEGLHRWSAALWPSRLKAID